MFNVQDKHQNRTTLSIFNLLNRTQIKSTQISNKYRFQSLDKNEIEISDWIKELYLSDTHILKSPETIKPLEARPQERKCESDLSYIEDGTNSNRTPTTVIEILNDKNYQSTYESIPIVDGETEKLILSKKFVFPINIEKKVYNYLYIKDIKFDGKGYGGTSLYIFSYLDSPLMEPIRVDFSQSPPKITSYSRLYEDFMIPFLPNSYLILILFQPQEKAENKIIENPIFIGFSNIDQIKDENNNLNISWTVFKASESIKSLIETPLNYRGPIPQINFTFNKTNNIIPEKCVRLTSYFENSLFYPTPLLTIHGIKLKIPNSQNNKSTQVNCIFSLKTSEENPKLLPFGSYPYSTILTETISTSFLKIEEIVFFPEPINFYLSFTSFYKLQLNVDVYLTQDNKSKLTFTQSFNITDINQKHHEKLIHKGSMFSFKGLMGHDKCSITFFTMYPIIMAQPLSLIKQSSNSIDFQNPLFKISAPTILQNQFTLNSLSNIDIPFIIDILSKSNLIDIYSWVNHDFSCTNEFSIQYLNLLPILLPQIPKYSLFFFYILFKSLISLRNLPFESLQKLFFSCSNEKIGIEIKESASTFLLLLRGYFDPRTIHKLSLFYLKNLSLIDRLKVCQILFSDMAFIQSLIILYHSNINHEKAFSPYIPVISLFFSTIREAFLANNKDTTNSAIEVISTLSVTLEQYSDNENAIGASIIFFPLLTIIFTFSDSLASQLQKDDPRFAPMILYIIKFRDLKQFISYNNLLSSDNQIRFLDMLTSLTQIKMVQAVAQRSINLNNHILSCAHEITFRILHFLRFLENIQSIENRSLQAIFTIIINMLSPQQDSEAFLMVFKSLSFIVEKFFKEVFIEKTNHVNYILNSIVTITQRKLWDAKVSAIGFICWMIDLENKVNSNTERSLIALQLAFCNAFFTIKSFTSFIKFLPNEFSKSDQIISLLQNAVDNSSIYFIQIKKLLEVYQFYKHFPAIRARIYKHIIEINKKNDDFFGAFVVQWKLCSLISDVFKIKNIKIDGLPENGSSGFKYISHEDLVEEIKDSSKSSYLMLEDEIFTESSMIEALTSSLTLCQRAGFHWIIGPVSRFLLNQLEKKREFLLLQDIFGKITDSYTELSKGEKPLLEFYLLSFRGQISKDLDLYDTIHISSLNGLSQLKNMILDFNSNIKIENNFKISEIPKESEKSIVYITKVHYNHDQLNELLCNDFIYDQKFGEVSWEDFYLERFIFKTKYQLPGPVSNSPVIESFSSKLTSTG